MDIDSAFIKVLPQSFAKNVVQDYNKQEPLAKVSYLQSLETQYGEQYGRVGLILTYYHFNGVFVI